MFPVVDWVCRILVFHSYKWFFCSLTLIRLWFPLFHCHSLQNIDFHFFHAGKFRFFIIFDHNWMVGFNDGLKRALEFNLNWFVILVFLFGFLFVSMFCSPFPFLSCIDVMDVLGKESVGKTFPLTTSLLHYVDPISPLILVTNFLGCCLMGVFCSSSEWIYDIDLYGVSSASGCMLEAL